MKTIIVALTLLSTPLYAAPYIVYTPSSSTQHYTPVLIDNKKLKTTLAEAKAQFPGEEYIVLADTNAALTHAPAVFNGLWTYNNVSSSFYGISKAPKVDGLKATGVSNFVVTQTTLSPTYPVNVSFTKPTKEFGVFLATTNMAGGVFTDSVTVKVGGVEVDTVSLPAFQSTFVGVRASDGEVLGPVTFTPSIFGYPGYVAPFVTDSFYIE